MTSRHQAREAALQILYLWEIGKANAGDALSVYFAEHAPDADPEVRSLAETIARGTIERVADLDATIARHTRHWRIERLSVIDRLILRMGAWELQHMPGTPPAVVLNEAVELARTFGNDDSVKFVNGVLDSIRRDLTP